MCIGATPKLPAMSDETEATCKARGVDLLGRIPFAPMMVTCQIQGLPVTDSDTSLAAYSIRELWRK